MKKIIRILLTIILITGVFCVFAAMASAQATTPEMNIAYCNLSFRDSVCIKYAVEANVSDVKILIWTSPETNYVVGTQDKEITKYYTEDIDGTSHMIFDYTELTAKQMTDVVYARAYAKVDGVDYYSEVNKYSILQYAYNMLGMTADASSDTEFKEMLTNMLLYGASAQKYFDYKEDRLATDNWYQVKLTAGLLDDGCTHGLYLYGDKVTLIALETDAKGHAFSHWVDSNGNNIGTMATYELMVGTENQIYTPIYKHTEVINEAVAPTCNKTGLTQGSHCSVCGEVIVVQTVIDKVGHNFIDKICQYCGANDSLSELKEDIAILKQKCIEIEREFSYISNSIYKHSSDCDYNACTIEKIADDYYWNYNEYVEFKYMIDTYDSEVCKLENDEEIDFERVNELKTYIERIDFKYSGGDRFIADIVALQTELFYLNGHITNVVIPLGDTLIDRGRFYGYSGLTSITIPDSVESIGELAFYGCTSLISINYSGTSLQWNAITKKANWNEDIGSYIIYCTDGEIAKDGTITCYHNYLSTVSAPTATENGSVIYTCSGCGDIYTEELVPTDFTITKNNREYIGETGNNLVIPAVFEYNGVWYRVISISSFAFENYRGVTSVTIPDTVTSIGERAFAYCQSLASVTIPDSVTTIGDYAFYDCESLRSVSFGKKVKNIGNYAFSSCNRLTMVVIPDSVENIGYYAFSYCDDLSTISIGSGVKCIDSGMFRSCYDLYSVSIGNNVTSIGDEAFAFCELSSITIPDSVESIGKRAFGGCTGLISINYSGTSLQWNAITKKANWNENTGSYIIYCTDGEFAKDETSLL